jgi:hypothetical protein
LLLAPTTRDFSQRRWTSFAATEAAFTADADAFVAAAPELLAFVTATQPPNGPAIALLRHRTTQALPFGPPVQAAPVGISESKDKREVEYHSG